MAQRLSKEVAKVGRGDATKVIAEMAYQPEPRWKLELFGN